MVQVRFKKVMASLRDQENVMGEKWTLNAF
jgi:hypothetical protein